MFVYELQLEDKDNRTQSDKILWQPDYLSLFILKGYNQNLR